MNGKKGSIKVDIPKSEVANNPLNIDVGSPATSHWVREVWEFVREDTDRVIFSLKAGLAVLLVSLLILIRAPYNVFGTSIIWSILTVALMFEYTVGATFNRGFNRALGSLFAGILAVLVMQVAMACGQNVEPYIIGFSIFIIGAATSFMKQLPSLTPYEYGFRVTLFTYCLIIVSGYRMGSPARTAMDRLYSIAIGGLVAVLVNALVFPIWSGEQLHRELVGSLHAVANSLEECVKKYLADDGSSLPEFSKTVADDFPDEPAFRKCRKMLNSSAKFETLVINIWKWASSAKWEPPHGRFRQFFYPWPEYVKVGAVLRYCAYEVMALHGCLHSEIQAPYNLRCTFQPEIVDAANQAAELLRSLAKDINSMKWSLHGNLLKRVHSSTERLQRSIDMHSYLLTSTHEIHDCPAKLPQSQVVCTISFKHNDMSDQPKESESKNEQNNLSNAKLEQAESYHEAMRKQQRRLYSWPSREVDDFEDEDVDNKIIQKMRAFESTAALSLATFTSLLIEFVARLDHLVDATDVLAKMAKFKKEYTS